ncbi:hypothetical protein PC118_g17250 [Phytophthora cactorum]|uniref:Protein kinase domain-containing protein n=1 Tax=Phytophthora cactorum TaxID=29920 RepID=A0A8T1FC13_9STRA|nr:hypothetical protein PC118_g17250 [Phytophthora cactorum]
MLMMPAPSLSIQVHPSLQTVYVRMKDRSGTVAIDMTPSLLSPKSLIVRFHELAFGKSFAAFAANSSLLARRRNEETLVTSLNDLQDGEVLVYRPCEELRTLVEQGCITPVLATHSPLVDVSPSSSPLGLKRKGRAKSVTNNVERVHRYASDLAKMDVSPKERELIEDMLIVGDEQVVDAMEQFVVHRNPALVRRVLRGPAAKRKSAALDNLSVDFSSMDMHSPAVPTSGDDFSDPFLVGGQNPFVQAVAESESQRPSMMNVDDHTTTEGGRPSLLFDGDALSSPPIFLQSIKEKVTPPSGKSARMSLSLSNDLDPSRNAQTPTQLFSVEKLLDNVPVARDFHEKYSVGAVLGSGKYSVVKRLSEVANLHDAPATSATGLPSATDMVRNRMARAHTKCGTRDYIAPEVMIGKGYGTEADLWSVGVVTYVLASGCAPVFLPTAEGVKKVFFADETWSGASEDLKRFIEALLVRNPEKRITAADALEHPWLKE